MPQPHLAALTASRPSAAQLARLRRSADDVYTERLGKNEEAMQAAYAALEGVTKLCVAEGSRGYLPDWDKELAMSRPAAVPLQRSHVDGLDGGESEDAACLTSDTVRTTSGTYERRATNFRNNQSVKRFAAASARGPAEILTPAAGLLLTHNGVDAITGVNGAAGHDVVGVTNQIGPTVRHKTTAAKTFVGHGVCASTAQDALRDNLVLALLASPVNEGLEDGLHSGKARRSAFVQSHRSV